MVSKRYLKAMLENPLHPLPEDERIYFNTSFAERGIARACNCRFDRERKIWFTGCKNSKLELLISWFGINEATSEKAMELMQAELKTDAFE